jgi:hypothetical protein
VIPRIRPLEREDSLVSLIDEFDATNSRGMLRNPIAHSVSNINTVTVTSPEITIEDLRRHVWIYARAQNESPDNGKIKRFEDEIVGHTIVKGERGGRKKVMDAIRKTAHSEEDDSWRKARQTEILTEKSYCARAVSEFLSKRHLPQPAFLQERLVRERITERRRKARR